VLLTVKSCHATQHGAVMIIFPQPPDNHHNLDVV